MNAKFRITKKVTTDYVLRLIKDFPWDGAIATADVSQEMHILNETMRNVFSNSIRNKTIVCDDHNQRLPLDHNQNKRFDFKKELCV